MKYQIEEYKDHFKIAKQIAVPCVVTPKWYQFWKSTTTTEHEVWAHMYRTDSPLNTFLSGSELKFKTKEKAQKHIEKLINNPKVKYPIIHEFVKLICFEGCNYTYKELTKLQHETLKRRRVDVLRLRDLERLIKKIDSETPASSMDRWTATFIKT